MRRRCCAPGTACRRWSARRRARARLTAAGRRAPDRRPADIAANRERARTASTPTCTRRFERLAARRRARRAGHPDRSRRRLAGRARRVHLHLGGLGAGPRRASPPTSPRRSIRRRTSPFRREHEQLCSNRTAAACAPSSSGPASSTAAAAASSPRCCATPTTASSASSAAARTTGRSSTIATSPTCTCACSPRPQASGLFHANDESDERVNDLVEAMSLQVAAQARGALHADWRSARPSWAPTPTPSSSIRWCGRRGRAKSAGSPSLSSVARNVPRLLEERRNR